MRIGVNLHNLESWVGGIYNYVMTLLREWPKYSSGDELVLFTFPLNDELLAELPPESRAHEIRPHDQGDIMNYMDGLDVYFCPFGAIVPYPVPKPTVFTLVDIQERFFPSFFSPADIAHRLFFYDGSLRMANQVITLSEFSKRTMAAVVNIPGSKINIVHLCCDELPDSAHRPGVPEGWDGNFAFYPANDWPHKNHLRLLEALRSLRERGKTVRCVFTGVRKYSFDEIRGRIAGLELTDTVVHLGRVSRAEISWLYRHARILVFPSLFEGFGIPVIEAMASGLPVACSGTTSLPEVAGPAALYFDPMNVGDMAEKILRLWTDEGLREDLISRGYENHRRFDGRRLVERHRSVFRKAVETYRPWHYVWRKWLYVPWRRRFAPRRIPWSQMERARLFLRLENLGRKGGPEDGRREPARSG